MLHRGLGVISLLSTILQTHPLPLNDFLRALGIALDGLPAVRPLLLGVLYRSLGIIAGSPANSSFSCRITTIEVLTLYHVAVNLHSSTATVQRTATYVQTGAASYFLGAEFMSMSPFAELNLHSTKKGYIAFGIISNGVWCRT